MYIFIVNPVAGKGKSKRIFSKIAASDIYKQIVSSYYFTRYKGHAEKLVKQIIEEQTIESMNGIIVIGGDGTIHEVANGLRDVRVPLSFIPGGSGNDFARGIGMKGNPLEILERIVKQKETIPYWLGSYKVGQNKPRYFVNSIGFGFDAEIVKTANESFLKRLFNRINIGNLIYVVALIKVLFKFVPFTIDIEVDEQRYTFHRCWMVVFGNHPFYGGGMKIIPDATVQSDYLSILLIHNVSKWKVLALFMTVFLGKHTKYKEVSLLKGMNMKVFSKEPTFYQVDGHNGSCKTVNIRKELSPVHILVDGTQK